MPNRIHPTVHIDSACLISLGVKYVAESSICMVEIRIFKFFSYPSRHLPTTVDSYYVYKHTTPVDPGDLHSMFISRRKYRQYNTLYGTLLNDYLL